jgi:LuxR family transcriptional regulator, maltose regulon positive regulatory protein
MTEFQSESQRIKLHRPHAIAGTIERPRLHALLDQVLEKPLAIISAPAGFGKTTLLTQWLDRCPLPNAWLQLDKNDHEIPTFLFSILSALRQIFPGCLQKIADLQQAQSTVPREIWIGSLIADLELLGDTPFILALDDYHLIGNPSIDLMLAEVLHYAPLPLHLIISARHDPSLSFGRLEVQNRIVKIKSTDLRFTDSEALAYLSQTLQVPLNDTAINQLNEKTEGWAAGLALVAIKIRKEIQPEEIIKRLKGSDRLISDFLLNQVFNLQPDEIQEFLLKTATFSQFCAPMLEEVFDSKQSEGEIQELIERIEDAQLFLIPLDTQRAWYRYHHLFRQMLLSRQRISYHPDQIALFHQRGATWLIQHGQEQEGLYHLLAVQDWLGAAQLVESQFLDLLNKEDFQGIIQRLAHFSEDLLNTRPGLLLMQAWIAHRSFQVKKIYLLTAKIQTLLDAALNQSDPAETGKPLPGFEGIPYEIVQAQVWALESICLYLTNQGSQALPLARQAVDALPETWMFARGNAMIYLGLSMFMDGQYHQMVEMIKQAYESLQKPGTSYGARLLYALTVSHLLQGELELCRQSAELMIRYALDANLLVIQSWGHYLLGRVYQEWNELELAVSHYQQVIDQRFTSHQYCALDSMLNFAFVQHILGRHELAQQSLDSIQYHSAAAPQPVLALTAWLKHQHGYQTEARRWAESFYEPVAREPIVWDQIPQILKIKILMDADGFEASQAVNQHLDELEALAERTHNNFTLMRVLAMRAVWLARQGEFSAAQQTLMRALHLGRSGGFIHSFLIQGPEMLKLLQAALSQLKDEPDTQAYLELIIASFLPPADSQPAPASQPEMITLLTEREHEVLKLLAERLSIKEISTLLYISPSTVQQHTHHIYRKLNVNNKRQAVAKAAELGILSS